MNWKTTATAAALTAVIGPLTAASTALAGDQESKSWTRWGGPSQNFRAPAADLSESWPPEGPPKIWSRELGDGYSTILVENGRLYTMYRAGDDEAVIALDAKTGATLWETRYDHDPHENHVTQFGVGPRATPLLAGNRIYTIGVAGLMHAIDKSTGDIVWSKNLWGEDFGGDLLPHGYASSPVEYGDTVIALVGGELGSIVALDKQTGDVVWRSLEFTNSYATPQILEIAGRTQLVTFMAKELIGVDPDDGSLLWRYPVENQFGQNINPPILVDGEVLFLSSLQAGSRGLGLSQIENGGIEVEELWATRKIQFYHVTSVGDGDYVYGTTGGGSPAFMSAINVKTGKVPWRRRGFAKANTIFADGHLIVLDEDGELYLTTATPEDITIHAQASLLDRVAWTAPTLVGQTMYVRDKAKIMALDLGASASDAEASPAVAAEVTAELEPENATPEPVEAAAGTSQSATEAAPTAPMAEESEAMKILRRADAATRAVQGVSYRATSEPAGSATDFLAPATGEFLMRGWTGNRPEVFRAGVRSTQVGSTEKIDVGAGGNGDLYYLTDHIAKKTYVDMDPNVLGSSGRTVGSIRMIEFVHPTPFSDEINADSVELQGTEEIEGVECHKIDVVYSGGRGHSVWYFSTDDFLPRRRTRIFQGPQGEGSVVITISDLTVNPAAGEAAFEFEIPEGYERIEDFAP